MPTFAVIVKTHIIMQYFITKRHTLFQFTVALNYPDSDRKPSSRRDARELDRRLDLGVGQGFIRGRGTGTGRGRGSACLARHRPRGQGDGRARACLGARRVCDLSRGRAVKSCGIERVCLTVCECGVLSFVMKYCIMMGIGNCGLKVGTYALQVNKLRGTRAVDMISVPNF